MGTTTFGRPVGHGLGRVGLVLAFLIPPAGLVVSIVARAMSGRAGQRSTVALVGVVVGIALTAAGAMYGVGAALGELRARTVCEERGPGDHLVGSTVYVCDFGPDPSSFD